MRSYGSSGVLERIRAAGGEVYGVTSEPQRLASRAQEEWSLDFECIGDPHQEISAHCSERGWLELVVNTELGFLHRSARNFDPAHPKGYFQPGVLALSPEGRVLYRWRSIPSRKNIGGAISRPTPGYVFDALERSLSAGPDGADAVLDADPELDAADAPWPLFVALLIANGWFVAPRAFDQRTKGRSARQRIRVAFGRLFGFVALWGVAFATLPTVPVALALAGWIAWITPRVRWINREFQSISAPE